MLSFDQLTADALWQISVEKRPHLVPEGELLRGETQIHQSKLLKSPRD
jgi:hypothetical protein